MTIETIFFSGLAVYFFIWSMQSFRKRWVFHAAGFNIMTKEQRKKFDTERLSKCFGVYTFIMSLCFLSIVFLPENLVFVMLGVTFILTMIVIVLVNSSYVKIDKNAH